ncbi:hypothetical protein [Streptosporangium sp. H16]|uniref:hypothetical protein n=1 Tax=Streptosporangium sp. H16 TaxID=3444184 RepID=UPI003F7A5F9A
MIELSPAVHAFLQVPASPACQHIVPLFTRGGELSVGQVAELIGRGQPCASEQLAEPKRGGIASSPEESKIVLSGPTGTPSPLPSRSAGPSSVLPPTINNVAEPPWPSAGPQTARNHNSAASRPLERVDRRKVLLGRIRHPVVAARIGAGDVGFPATRA